jgi:hypothetical protein
VEFSEELSSFFLGRSLLLGAKHPNEIEIRKNSERVYSPNGVGWTLSLLFSTFLQRITVS